MGIGRLQSDRFTLFVSLRHDADAARMEQWRASFQRFSDLLFDATDGQHQIGTVFVCNNSTGGRNADAWLLKDDGRSNSPCPGLGRGSVHQTLFADERFKPFVLLHEFGHYAYGVFDEYCGTTADDGLSCIGGSTSDACIMETAWNEGDRFGDNGNGGPLVPGRVSEFCVPGNHDPNNDTYQSTKNHESCWQTMVAAFPGLSLPSGTPTANPPAGAGSITWTILEEQQQFVLVLDRSGSMAGPKIGETRFGADWWVDNAVIGDRLGIVSYSDTAKVDFPLREIISDADRDAAHKVIFSLSATGRTAIGAGLRAALGQIVSAGALAATQVIVLLTDGFHNAGESPDAVLPDLQANGIRVYTLGVGPDIDSVLLSRIATTTGGEFYRIDPTLSADQQAFEIRTRLQEISGIARENGGVVAKFSEKISEGQRVQRRVHIESGCDMATFGFSWKSSRDRLFLSLFDPNGRRIKSSTPGVRIFGYGRPYNAFQVTGPQPGEWTMEVYDEGIQTPGGTVIEGFVFSQNRAIDGGLSSPKMTYSSGDSIPLRLQTYFSQPLTGLNVTAVARLASGNVSIPLDFRDDGELTSGDQIAGDGMYHATFEALGEGIYEVEAVVSNDGSATYCNHGEKLLSSESYSYPPIPVFVRRFRLSLLVGDEAIARIRIHPDRGFPGGQLKVEISGSHSHFIDEATLAGFGQGIRVTEVQVLDDENAVALLVIDQDAVPGFRDVVVATPAWHEFLELSNGFQILCPRVALSTPEPRRLELAPRRRLVEQLVYDTDGVFVGIRLERVAAVIMVSSGLEAVFKEARATHTRVTLISDEGTGDILSVEIG